MAQSRFPLAAPLIALAVLAGCADWPDPVIPTAAESAGDDWPTMVPLGPILARGAAPLVVPPPPADRVAALNARAAALRGRPVIDPASRARLRAGVDPVARAALN